MPSFSEEEIASVASQRLARISTALTADRRVRPAVH
ncbi:hypothetical protein RKD45_000602 [Streptomyces griseus]